MSVFDSSVCSLVCKSKSCEVSERIALGIYVKMLLKSQNVILDNGLYVERKILEELSKEQSPVTMTSCSVNVSVFLQMKSGPQSSQEF